MSSYSSSSSFDSQATPLPPPPPPPETPPPYSPFELQYPSPPVPGGPESSIWWCINQSNPDNCFRWVATGVTVAIMIGMILVCIWVSVRESYDPNSRVFLKNTVISELAWVPGNPASFSLTLDSAVGFDSTDSVSPSWMRYFDNQVGIKFIVPTMNLSTSSSAIVVTSPLPNSAFGNRTVHISFHDVPQQPSNISNWIDAQIQTSGNIPFSLYFKGRAEWRSGFYAKRGSYYYYAWCPLRVALSSKIIVEDNGCGFVRKSSFELLNGAEAYFDSQF